MSIRRRARRRFNSIPWTSSASCRAIWRSRSAMSAPPAGTSASAARRKPRSSTSTRSIPLSHDRCSRSAAAGIRRSCASRSPIRSSVSRRQASLAGSPTIQRGQLLRPFPEFGDVLKQETTTGSRRQYHAATFILEKRTGAGLWGGRMSYTFSNTKDNQFGQPNIYAWRATSPQNNYDLDSRVRHQHLRLAAPDHPGAALQLSLA